MPGSAAAALLTGAMARYAEPLPAVRLWQNGQPRSLDDMPDECLALICSFLSAKSLLRMARVSRRMNRVARGSELWRRQYSMVFNMGHVETAIQADGRVRNIFCCG